jgi:lipopolysaccharide biosynthesis glycosyltransferase
MARRHLQKENEEYLEKILDNARIWHYTGPKPWNKPQMNYAVASHWWKACSRTPLLERHLAKFSNTMQQHILESIEGQQRTLQEFLC